MRGSGVSAISAGPCSRAACADRSALDLLDPRIARAARNATTDSPSNGSRQGAQLDGPGRPGAAAPAGARPQLARRAAVDRAQRVVELAHAAEARAHRDLGERQLGRLDQRPGGLRSLGARELQPGLRPQLGREDPAQLPLEKWRRSAGRPRRRGRPPRPRSGASRVPPSTARLFQAGDPGARRGRSACRRGSPRAGRPPVLNRRTLRGTAAAPGSSGGSTRRSRSRRRRRSRRSAGRGSA